jgi:hypothetical protein
VVGLLRVAIVLCGGWLVLQLQGDRLEWLYALIAGATVLGARALGSALVIWPPIRPQKRVSG